MGTDGLRYSPTVVAQQRVGGADYASRAAVVDLERMIAGAGKQIGELDQPGRISAVVAVDGLVVVAHAEHCCIGAGQQPDEQEVCRGEVLELIDQKESTGALCRCTRLRVAQQQLDRLEDLLVVVDRVGSSEFGAVAQEDVGEALDLAVVARLDLLRVDQTEPCQRQGLQPRGHRIRVAHPRELHHPADEPPYFGFVDGVEPLGLARERGAAVDDRQRDGVERAHLQAGEIGGAGRDLFLGAFVERDERDCRRRQPPLLYEVAGAFGEHTRLARTGRSDDARRAARVGDGRELVGC
ncbi:unannotated protein [freshwater metagenome]|uniref:Unannotated protein n=1 Tax=freshwater metagenome TaxID=449393 RepID=A0A6J7ADR1_9ZZZZ